MLANNDKFKNKFELDFNKLPKQYQNSTNKNILEQEMNDLIHLRTVYRTGFSKIESCNFKDVLIAGQQVLPVNVFKVLENIAYYHADYNNSTTSNIEQSSLQASTTSNIEQSSLQASTTSNIEQSSLQASTTSNVISPVIWKQFKDQIKKRLPYTHYNEMCYNNGIVVPEYITMSLTLMNMSIDMDLCYKNVFDKNIDQRLMELIGEKIIMTYKKSLIEYGTSIGMIASECTSESMTQRILDSIHASGVSKANFLTRIKEVYGGKKTEQLSDPYMDIFVKEEYSDDLSTMHQIANEIEMMTLKTFTTRAQIFFEYYKEIIHPEYKDEIKTIFNSFEKHHVNQKLPQNLIKWCVRLELSHSTMIEKTMQINTIYRKLIEQHPLLYIIYTDDNAEKIIMRIYMQKDIFKKDINIDQEHIHEFVHSRLLKTVIRGVEGINSAVVLKEFVPRSIEQSDGSIKVIRKHIIRTSGTNLKEILNHSLLDFSKTSSNSIMEIQELYGIHAARMKLIQCLRELSGSDINIKHYTLIADTLIFNGFVSNIEKSGLEDSNVGNALLSMSFSHPIQKITEAALQNDESVVHTNISSSLMLGTTPDIGSNYNGILMNERFIQEHTKDVADMLDNM
jgi:DNA-directed RNA polymerase II subunit RPB1